MIAPNASTNSTEENLAPTRPQRKRNLAVIPKPKPERIRTELNIEKWPAIWNPTHSKSHSKTHVQSRTLEREITNADGTKSLSKVTINPIAQLGDLSTDDQRTLYALIKNWEDRGKPDRETPFSIRHLAKLLNKKWGTNVIDSVTGSLERLRGTLLVWTRSYRSKDERVEDSETVYVNILSKLKIVRRRVDGHITTEAGYFQFDDHILKNLFANYTKPFLFDVFMEIKGEIALKLYAYLDLILADKQRFERCTKDLFEDLGLKGESYRHPSKRKQNLEKAVEELEGIALTTGVLKSIVIEKTKDGKDYKAVFQKTARSEFLDEPTIPETTFTAATEVVVNDYSKQRKQTAVLEAEELVQHFHKIFHGVENHSVQSKETSQALTLVSQHGLEAAKRIVDFARAEAAKTNFQIQHFGAVLNYASRAIADIDRQRRQEEHSQVVIAEQTRRVEEDQQKWEKGERRLAALTPEQYQARFEKNKASLYAEYPKLAQFVRGREDSKLHEGAIRARMIRELEQEEMSLLVIDQPTGEPSA